jgi:hypothetical protein
MHILLRKTQCFPFPPWEWPVSQFTWKREIINEKQLWMEECLIVHYIKIKVSHSLPYWVVWTPQWSYYITIVKTKQFTTVGLISLEIFEIFVFNYPIQQFPPLPHQQRYEASIFVSHPMPMKKSCIILGVDMSLVHQPETGNKLTIIISWWSSIS